MFSNRRSVLGFLVSAGASPSALRRQPLFNGKTLKGWRSTAFGGEGPVRVKQGQIVMTAGDPLTGITWSGGDLPQDDYQLTVEAARLSGNDFFCALTVPVGPGALTLVVGGWGGALVGLSNVDDLDASENSTRTTMGFKDKKFYRVALRVAADRRVTAQIDDRTVVDVATLGHKLSLRPEVELARPLGITTYLTTAAIRGIWLDRGVRG